MLFDYFGCQILCVPHAMRNSLTITGGSIAVLALESTLWTLVSPPFAAASLDNVELERNLLAVE